MFADLWLALRRGWNELRYWRHTYSPFSPWKRRTDELIAATGEEASRYGIEAPAVDRRRAYQIARMVAPNRHGSHVVDVLPDAYRLYAPASKATVHAGRKSYPTIEERRRSFLTHPQTLAYLLTPAVLSRAGVGSSPRNGLIVCRPGETSVSASVVAQRLWKEMRGQVSKEALERYAGIVAALHAGPAEAKAETPEAA